MNTVSIRDLRYDFRKVEQLLSGGHEVRVTRRNRVIARLVPENMRTAPLPDFMARLRANFAEPLAVTGAEIISQDRDGR